VWEIIVTDAQNDHSDSALRALAIGVRAIAYERSCYRWSLCVVTDADR